MKLKIGNKELSIRKSNSLIGVKKRKAKKDNNHSDSMEIGGFEILQAAPEVKADDYLDVMRKEKEVEVGTHVYRDLEDESYAMVPTGDIYLVFKKRTTKKRKVALFDRFFLTIKEERGSQEYIMSVSPKSPNPIKVAMALQEEKEVMTCEPNLAYPIVQHGVVSIPSNAFFSKQWHILNTGSIDGESWGMKAGADAKIFAAWNELGNMGDPSVVVSVVDDGFDLSHPAFKGKIIKPYDFETKSTTTLLRRANDTHGTNCAGVAIAANNSEGIIGVAPNARFMPVRTYGIDDEIIERLFDYMIANGADVMSNSWGIPGKILSTRIFNAIRKAYTQGRRGRGLTICFAAGNEGGKVTGFAAHPDVICVGASSSQDVWSDYSNQGSEVWLACPSNGDGRSIITTDVGVMTDENGQVFDAGEEGLYRDDFGGTSSACPLAAGVVALMYSANSNLTSVQVKAILKATCDKIGGAGQYNANGHSPKYGYGRINAQKAVIMAKALKGTTPTIPTPNPTAPVTPPAQTIPLLLRASHKSALAGSGAFKYFGLNLGKSMIVQCKPNIAGLDVDLFVRKGAIPDLAKSAFDKRGVQQANMLEYTVDNAAAQGDYYILVTNKSGLGEYGLQATVGASTGAVVNPNSPITFLRLQSFVKGKFNRAGEQHIYMVSYSTSLTLKLAGLNGNAADFDLYYRKNTIPIPAGRQYDDSSQELETSDELIRVIGTATQGDYYFLVRSSDGGGDFELSVELG